MVAFSRLGCCLFLDIHFFGGGRKIEKKKRLGEKVGVGSKGCSTNNKKRVSAFSPPNSPAVSSGLMNSGMCELDLERRTRRAFSGSRKAHSRAVSPFFFSGLGSGARAPRGEAPRNKLLLPSGAAAAPVASKLHHPVILERCRAADFRRVPSTRAKSGKIKARSPGEKKTLPHSSRPLFRATALLFFSSVAACRDRVFSLSLSLSVTRSNSASLSIRAPHL